MPVHINIHTLHAYTLTNTHTYMHVHTNVHNTQSLHSVYRNYLCSHKVYVHPVSVWDEDIPPMINLSYLIYQDHAVIEQSVFAHELNNVMAENTMAADLGVN